MRLAPAARAEQAVLDKEPDTWWRTMQARLLGTARAALAPDELAAAERAGAGTAFAAVVEEVTRGPTP